jgi:hypothetical protein
VSGAPRQATEELDAGRGVRWVRSEQEYAAHAADPDGNQVPVLIGAGVPAARWSRILRTHYADHVALAPRTRLVLACGTEAKAPAELYARLTGARLALHRTPAECCAAIGDCDVAAVLVVSVSSLLTVRAVLELLSAARNAGSSIGMLTGRDQSRLSYTVAKALLGPRKGLNGLKTFDAPSHRDHDNPALPPDERLRELESPSLVKALRAHGEGGHAKFPGVVICGVLEVTEFPTAPEGGCSQEPRRCKRAAASGARVIFGHELPARTICFLCCNGFNVAGELYPSEISLALSFLEGFAAAVIAPLRPLVAPDEMLATIEAGVDAGVSLAELVEDLNQISRRNGDRDAFVLLGDPTEQLQVLGQSGDARPAAGLSVDSEALEMWLGRLLGNAERGRRVLRATRLWLFEEPPAELVALERRFSELERLIVNTMKWAQVRPTGGSGRALLRAGKLIRLRTSEWDDLMARLLLESRATLDPFDIGHYDQVLTDVTSGGPCPRCGTPTEVGWYGMGEPAAEARVAELCVVCGPLSEARHEGVSVVVAQVPARAMAGERVSVTAQLAAPSGFPPLSDQIHLRMRCFDKANDRLIHDEAVVLSAGDQTVRFELAFEERTGLDLHSIRMVATGAFDVAYARARIACVPPAPGPDVLLGPVVSGDAAA